jgi:hypothetical protein
MSKEVAMSKALQAIPEASIFDRGWRFLMDQLVQDVPDAIAVCEFDCRETNCTSERWASCERRLRAVQGPPEAPRQAA